MSELKLEGTIDKIFDTQEVTDTFKKREFVIKTVDQYPQTVKFELTQNNCDKINDYKVGEDVIVHFNVRGREWKNKEGKVSYFVSLNAWRLQKDNSYSDSKAEAPKEDASTESFSDDLPF